AAAPVPPAGKRDIERLFAQPRRELRVGEAGATRLERRFYLLLGGIERHAGRPLFLGGTLRAKAEKRAPLAEVARLGVCERGRVSRRRAGGERPLDDCV